MLFQAPTCAPPGEPAHVNSVWLCTPAVRGASRRWVPILLRSIKFFFTGQAGTDRDISQKSSGLEDLTSSGSLNSCMVSPGYRQQAVKSKHSSPSGDGGCQF